MSLRAKMWIQIGGAVFFAAVALAEALGLKGPSFGGTWGPYILASGCVVMLFEAWRSWRKEKQATADASAAADSEMTNKKEVTG